MSSERLLLAAVVLGLAAGGCYGPSAGAACEKSEECPEDQACLTEFRGGYCGIKGCGGDADCPEDTFCVDHDGTNYCFLRCVDKVDCNVHRPPEMESNCSANIDAVEDHASKACVPPSGDE